MKMMKRIFVGCAVALSMATMSVCAMGASAYQSPAEAAAGVSGKTVEEVISLRQSGKRYGTIAAEAGKLEEFQKEVLEIHKTLLQDKVDKGLLTQEQADAQIAEMKERQAACDGTGSGQGLGCGNGQGQGLGRGNGQGQGLGRGNGQGQGLREESCLSL